MDSQNQIVEFLAKPENLPITLEIAKHIEDVRINLQNSFWLEITKALESRLKDSEISKRWEVKFEEDTKNDYKGCTFYIKNRPKDDRSSYLSLTLEQYPQKYNNRLMYGLSWNKEHKSNPRSPIINSLLQKSAGAGVSEVEGNSSYLVYLYLDVYTRSDDFALNYGFDKVGFVKDLSDNIWSYFELIEPDLFKFNKMMLNKKSGVK